MRTLKEIEADIAKTKEELANVKGGETEVYARIVGYYRSVRNWNRGKREEFDDRKMFDSPDEKKQQVFDIPAPCPCHSPDIESVDDPLLSKLKSIAHDICEYCKEDPVFKGQMKVEAKGDEKVLSLLSA